MHATQHLFHEERPLSKFVRAAKNDRRTKRTRAQNKSFYLTCQLKKYDGVSIIATQHLFHEKGLWISKILEAVHRHHRKSIIVRAAKNDRRTKSTRAQNERLSPVNPKRRQKEPMDKQLQRILKNAKNKQTTMGRAEMGSRGEQTSTTLKIFSLSEPEGVRTLY